MHNIDSYSNQLIQKYSDLDNHILGIWAKVGPSTLNNDLEFVTDVNQETNANIATLISEPPQKLAPITSPDQVYQIKKHSWFGRLIKTLLIKIKGS